MKRIASATLLGLAMLGSVPAQAAATVDVQFGDLSKFTDLKSSNSGAERDQQGLAEALRRHLVAAAPARIPDGTRLEVKITDVDMAGDFRPSSAAYDVRIVREIYPPRIELDFRLLRADGRVEREGHRDLRDTAFMMGAGPMTTESLRYEKALLDDWLRREFKPAANANR